jgi:hypothetical protein
MVGKTYEIKRVQRDGKTVVKLKCPNCGVWGVIDEDQFWGKVSIICPECSLHETVSLGLLELRKHKNIKTKKSK